MNLEDLAKLPARGIIFSPLMVKAILEDRKTNSRRLDKRWLTEKKGDRLWVRESHYRYGKYVKSKKGWWSFRSLDEDGVDFGTFGGKIEKEDIGWHKRPSIFMPRWAARIYLEATADARLERLQDISEEDAKKEGPTQHPDWPKDYYCFWKNAFKALWDSLNGKKTPWESNPEVVVLSFKRMRGD